MTEKIYGLVRVRPRSKGHAERHQRIALAECARRMGLEVEGIATVESKNPVRPESAGIPAGAGVLLYWPGAVARTIEGWRKLAERNPLHPLLCSDVDEYFAARKVVHRPQSRIMRAVTGSRFAELREAGDSEGIGRLEEQIGANAYIEEQEED